MKADWQRWSEQASLPYFGRCRAVSSFDRSGLERLSDRGTNSIRKFWNGAGRRSYKAPERLVQVRVHPVHRASGADRVGRGH